MDPSTSAQSITVRTMHPYSRSFHPFVNMSTPDRVLYIGGAVLVGFVIGLSIITCWIKIKRRLEDDQWQPPWRQWQPPWRQWLSNRGRRARRRWEGLTSLDGAVELGHMNGAVTGTSTALAMNTAHGTTHATVDDTATGEASGTAAFTLDALTFTTFEVTLNGAASGPH